MKVSELAPEEVVHRMRRVGLGMRVEPFTVRLRSPVRALARDVARMYADFPVAPVDGFADFHVRIVPPRGIRRWIRPQINFQLDRECPFNSLARDHAFAFFEWGLNWCIHGHIHEHLVIHAAVAERDGFAVVMPGEPGAGKSTLCAALVERGWRLLSDELAMIVPASGELIPVVRPISLKNESIDVIRALSPQAVLGREVFETTKGVVTHVRPPPGSVARAAEPARPGWLLFPRYDAAAVAGLEPMSKGTAFMQAAEDSFNYSVLGTKGFTTLARFVESVDCYSFRYGDLEEALAVLGALEPPGSGSG